MPADGVAAMPALDGAIYHHIGDCLAALAAGAEAMRELRKYADRLAKPIRTTSRRRREADRARLLRGLGEPDDLVAAARPSDIAFPTPDQLLANATRLVAIRPISARPDAASTAKVSWAVGDRRERLISGRRCQHCAERSNLVEGHCEVASRERLRQQPLSTGELMPGQTLRAPRRVDDPQSGESSKQLAREVFASWTRTEVVVGDKDIWPPAVMSSKPPHRGSGASGLLALKAVVCQEFAHTLSQDHIVLHHEGAHRITPLPPRLPRAFAAARRICAGYRRPTLTNSRQGDSRLFRTLPVVLVQHWSSATRRPERSAPGRSAPTALHRRSIRPTGGVGSAFDAEGGRQ